MATINPQQPQAGHAMSGKPFDLDAELARLPAQPGVYRMYADAAAEDLIYIGKAKNLKNRVRSYFRKTAQHSPKVRAMVAQVVRFDYIVTDSEIEALLLECNLIKQFHPKYNILLRDDKRYPWLALSSEKFPRLFITRDPSRLPKGAKIFGPYTSSGNMYHTMKVIRQHFPMRQRRTPLFKNRPCMNYHLGTCPGPCQDLITREEYAETLRQVELLLKGKADDLLDLLAAEMQQASEAMEFEKAADLRDRYQAVEAVVVQQKVFYPDGKLNQDIVASATDERRFAANVLTVRRGKLIGSKSFEIPLTHQSTPEEAYGAFVYQYYQDMPVEDRPDEVLLQHALNGEDEILLAQWIGQGRKRKVTISYPQKGVKKELIEMSVKNAREALDQVNVYEANRLRKDPAHALLELQEALDLPDLPVRMECYDISHFQGSQTVASMVVFTDGAPDKGAYRRFKINTAEGRPDDFRSMNEVIARRFSPEKLGSEKWPTPDLVIIDGGKGQLSAAVDALRAQGLTDQPIISLAKKFEEVFLPGQSRPVLLSRSSQALFLLQQIRDEAHRFAITYHRNLRGKAATQSMLDDIPGIGEKTRTLLLEKFGSVAGLKKATLDELLAVKGLNRRTAEILYIRLRH